jgi:hypothetical protein
MIGYPTIKFTIDEIADPAEAKPDGESGNVDIGTFPEIQLILPAKDPSSDQESQVGAVKRHAATPGSRDFQRMGDIIAEIVEKNIAQSPSYHHT